MKIIWGQQLSIHDGECKYLKRWVLQFKWFSLRLHHWTGNDDLRYDHNHPWWFISFVLWGSYKEHLPVVMQHGILDKLVWYKDNNTRIRRWLSLRYYPAEHSHAVETKNCWTLLLTGPQKYKWGFWVNGKLVTKKQYFKQFGHHQCE